MAPPMGCGQLHYCLYPDHTLAAGKSPVAFATFLGTVCNKISNMMEAITVCSTIQTFGLYVKLKRNFALPMHVQASANLIGT